MATYRSLYKIERMYPLPLKIQPRTSSIDV